MVMYIGKSLFRFRCTACDWHEDRLIQDSFLERCLPNTKCSFQETVVLFEKCPKCGAVLHKQKRPVHF